ncbi:flagellar basal body rod protein FlgB [Halodesulfovibrio sp.]|jgi:flagellar basal-body rod protein FlgB|uniref:flagellar basal body rod protein FlgB n=1 Tax=Halodesulfovibrio sp. TaxID=1912772 RepID=UPI0025EDDD4E|nr:flagellar basal body rod protein FlgB [Halodesulfovibrio sp.]MCT4536433.1 flagellar basal body rod protein FlgB [Halodesulfovibrio sp.]MCT4628088.1 flagellar basal body rod protein FlgB [Halodesulfovibrio sp.]
MKGLFETHTLLSAKVMDMQLQRQNVVMSNMANIKTPGYLARRVKFEEDLQKALNIDGRGKMTRTAGNHVPAAFDPKNFGPEWEKKMPLRVVHGEDRVDMDKEMAIMAKNTMRYNTLATVVKSNFDGMKNVISSGAK